MKKIKAGIVGGAGYTGGELIRLLIQHPNVSIEFISSTSNAGQKVSNIHKDLLGETDLVFSSKHVKDVDLLFLCMSHGKARIWLLTNSIAANTRIIDLSNDFRTQSTFDDERSFIYGLPELNRDKIKNAFNIANPGCFATAIQLALLPIVKHEDIQSIYTTGITGSTGAGQSLSSTSHFSWRANNIQAYKTLMHQHNDEILATIHAVSPNKSNVDLNFVPWRGDFTRGIYASTLVQTNKELAEIFELYKSYYATHPFTVLSESMIDLKQVINTNKCFLFLEKQADKLIVHSAIDNLLKGASGQAVQNMNLMFGLEETSALKLKANYF